MGRKGEERLEGLTENEEAKWGFLFIRNCGGVPRGSLPWSRYKIFTQYICASGLHLCREEFEGGGKE